MEILSGLNHPNIIKCIGYERTFSHFTIFFELMEGGSYVVVATGLLGDDVTPFDLAATGTTFGASNSDVVSKN